MQFWISFLDMSLLPSKKVACDYSFGSCLKQFTLQSFKKTSCGSFKGSLATIFDRFETFQASIFRKRRLRLFQRVLIYYLHIFFKHFPQKNFAPRLGTPLFFSLSYVNSNVPAPPPKIFVVIDTPRL
uniref:Uncharacterized protein n=1 Tax=Cacopsylla melanoneura TaxID=428564 RepID=A0A8D8ZNY2_9HEMI